MLYTHMSRHKAQKNKWWYVRASITIPEHDWVSSVPHNDKARHSFHGQQDKPLSQLPQRSIGWCVKGYYVTWRTRNVMQHQGLKFTPANSLSLNAFVDANWASNLDDRRSRLAYVCIFVEASSRGLRRNKKWSIEAQQSMNTELWPLPLQKSCGLSHSSMNLGSLLH